MINLAESHPISPKTNPKTCNTTTPIISETQRAFPWTLTWYSGPCSRWYPARLTIKFSRIRPPIPWRRRPTRPRNRPIRSKLAQLNVPAPTAPMQIFSSRAYPPQTRDRLSKLSRLPKESLPMGSHLKGQTSKTSIKIQRISWINILGLCLAARKSHTGLVRLWRKIRPLRDNYPLLQCRLPPLSTNRAIRCPWTRARSHSVYDRLPKVRVHPTKVVVTQSSKVTHTTHQVSMLFSMKRASRLRIAIWGKRWEYKARVTPMDMSQ